MINHITINIAFFLQTITYNVIYFRHPDLVNELNNLASSIYNLSPLDIPLDRHINPQNIITTSVDNDWYLIQIRNRYFMVN